MKTISHGDAVKWKKENPLNWENHPIQKGIKLYDKVYLQFTRDTKSHECYFMGLGENTPWGDKVRVFFPKKSGIFAKGERTFYLEDIGIGYTRKEAFDNYLQYKWFNRKKKDLHNHIFWQLQLLKND